MRNILFRGKTEKGEWVYGGILPELDIWTGKIKKYMILTELPPDLVRIQSDTLGQYSECNDKNAQRIYEGDIVKTCAFGKLIGNTCFDCSAEDIFIVKYDNGFVLENKERKYSLTKDVISLEIIGNIFDDKDKMKEWGLI